MRQIRDFQNEKKKRGTSLDNFEFLMEELREREAFQREIIHFLETQF